MDTSLFTPLPLPSAPVTSTQSSALSVVVQGTPESQNIYDRSMRLSSAETSMLLFIAIALACIGIVLVRRSKFPIVQESRVWRYE